MSQRQAHFENYPKQLRHSLDRSDVTYRLSIDLYAIRHSQAPASRDIPVANVEAEGGETILIYRFAADASRTVNDVVTPVYLRPPGDSPAVPTGRILVRFAEGTALVSRATALKRAGYRLLQPLAYAPHAGWVEAEDATTLSALKNIRKLERISGIVNVEPQLLTARVSRTT